MQSFQPLGDRTVYSLEQLSHPRCGLVLVDGECSLFIFMPTLKKIPKV